MWLGFNFSCVVRVSGCGCGYSLELDAFLGLGLGLIDKQLEVRDLYPDLSTI